MCIYYTEEDDNYVKKMVSGVYSIGLQHARYTNHAIILTHSVGESLSLSSSKSKIGGTELDDVGLEAILKLCVELWVWGAG